MIRAVVVKGPFTDEQFAELMAVVRRADDANPDAVFEVVPFDPERTALDEAMALFRQALPPRQGRETVIETVVAPPEYRTPPDWQYWWNRSGELYADALGALGAEGGLSVLVSRMSRELRRELGWQKAGEVLRVYAETQEEAARGDQ